MTGPWKKLGTGIPKRIPVSKTPIINPIRIDAPPMVGDPPHLDLEQTLREMHLSIQALQVRVEHGWDPAASDSMEENDEFVTSIAKAVSKKNTFGKILMWLVGAIGTIFSAGMMYAVFIGENATDTEVAKSIQNVMTEHNDSLDPESLDKDGEKFGHHPKLRKATEQLQKDMGQVKVDIGEIKRAQRKSDKRGEYQFEFSRWQAKVMECERTKKCKAPSKPAHLERLESDIHLGKFDDQ